MLVIFASLRPLRKVFVEVSAAETDRASVLGETIFGIKTVKSLAIEPERKSLWDERVALVGIAKLFEDYEEVGAAIGEASSVLNRPLESDSGSRGLRPRIAGAITFD